MMSRAKALALPLHPFVGAVWSFKNMLDVLVDRMYGTHERTRNTLMLAVFLGLLGFALQDMAHAMGPAMSACADAAAL